jgi:hypothetical protein
MARFNTEACKLGLRGITILIASGDDGLKKIFKYLFFTQELPTLLQEMILLNADFHPVSQQIHPMLQQ